MIGVEYQIAIVFLGVLLIIIGLNMKKDTQSQKNGRNAVLWTGIVLTSIIIGWNVLLMFDKPKKESHDHKFEHEFTGYTNWGGEGNKKIGKIDYIEGGVKYKYNNGNKDFDYETDLDIPYEEDFGNVENIENVGKGEMYGDKFYDYYNKRTKKLFKPVDTNVQNKFMQMRNIAGGKGKK